jgi:hypothetical protein
VINVNTIVSSPVTEINARFNGPPNSSNGGYACGVLGTLIGDCAEVMLHLPPPLETSMRLKQADGNWELWDEHLLVASGRPSELELDVPSPPTYEEARAAEPGYAGHEAHHFPTCFVCGPERDEYDGLRLFTGPLDGSAVVASHWLPGRDVAGEFDDVKGRVVWSALDCPTYFGGRLANYSPMAVLGKLTAKMFAPVEVDKPHIVIGWPIEAEGRKWHGGSAIYTADGDLCAYARGTWVVIPDDHAGFETKSYQ